MRLGGVHLWAAPSDSPALEPALGEAKRSVERIRISLAAPHRGVEEALTALPDGIVQGDLHPRIGAGDRSIAQLERLRQEVGDAHGQRKDAGNEVRTQYPEGEPRAAIAIAVAGIRQTKQRRWGGKQRLRSEERRRHRVVRVRSRHALDR